jgi:ABC-type transport system involved in multi-copper enzyme maturation permease subunit
MAVGFAILGVTSSRIAGTYTDASGKVTLVYRTSQELLSGNLLGRVLILASIFITIFIVSEFSCGILPVNVARGAPRIQIYFSKLIASICSFFILSILDILTSFICVRVAVEKFLLPDNFLLGLSFKIFISLCWICVVVAIAFFLKSKVWTITIVLLAIVLGSTGIERIVDPLVASIFKLPEVNLEHYWLLNYSSQAIFESGTRWIKENLNHFFYGELNYYIILGMVVSICYAIPAGVIGALKFRRGDLK